MDASQFTQKGVDTLRQLLNLRQLSLVSETIDDARLDLLRRLPRLKELHLSGTRVTEDGLRILGELPNVDSLTIVNFRVENASPYTPQFTDNGLAILAQHTKLKSLFLSKGTRV